MLFKTTEQEIVNLVSIVVTMASNNLDNLLLAKAFALAMKDQGVYDLMYLWSQSKDNPVEQDNIISDIKQSIKEYEKYSND
jgi:hypothetical protein